MIFHDPAVSELDLKTTVGMQQLVEVHLCGRMKISELSASDKKLLSEFVEKAITPGVTFQQFNELLLVLNQDRISKAFFEFFFRAGDVALTFGQLQEGVTRFKGYAMVCFGNFRFAFRYLSSLEETSEIRAQLGTCCDEATAVRSRYESRADKVLDVLQIPRYETWYVGEITGNLVAGELRRFDQYCDANPKLSDDTESVAFARRLREMDEGFKRVQEVALRNTDVYLTWDHLDVYVATSMRNRWEYEEIFDFTQNLFQSPELTGLKLRYFDPTQSKCRTSRDKGLLEGLMLKRAACTIYMAQETDTLGKDSELANTLAQGKPVIAFVPKITTSEYAKQIANRPLRFAKLRLLDLQAASGIFEDIDDLSRLTQSFLTDLSEHRKVQPFELWEEKDTQAFKDRKAYWPELCQRLA